MCSGKRRTVVPTKPSLTRRGAASFGAHTHATSLTVQFTKVAPGETHTKSPNPQRITLVLVLPLPTIPLIEDLTTGPVQAGSTILAEFVGASQWYNASVTMAVGWIRTGGVVAYDVFAQPPDNIRSQLKLLGLDVQEEERAERFFFTDGYSTTLGHKSKERTSYDSLKITDLSIEFSRGIMRAPPQPEKLIIVDNESTYARFNDEKTFVEFLLTRHFPSHILRKSTGVIGILKGVHSGWVYEQLESASEGVVDFKLEEEGKSTRDLIRIRSMRNVHFDREWHELKIGDNFEVTLEK